MKVLIADTQPTVRHALSVWISGQTDWQVVGESGDSSDLLKRMEQFVPEVIILDRNLPGLETGKLVKSIRQISKAVTIILLFNGPFEQFDTEPMDVDYYASKIDPPVRIIEAISKARCRDENKSHSSQEGQEN